MKILTAEMTRMTEERAVALGMDWMRLMENAGSAAATVIKKQFAVEKLRVCVVCGKGNNGGDGFVVARKLSEAGADVSVVLGSGHPKTPDALENYRRAADMGIPVFDYINATVQSLNRLRECQLVVDAIFGIGFSGVPGGSEEALIGFINSLDVPVVSLDLPSGVVCDSGKFGGVCVNADITITFSTLKPCHVSYPAAGKCGRVTAVGIGMPDSVFEEVSADMRTIDRADVDMVCARRRPDSHKGDFGRPLLICGSSGMAGAAGMAAKAALRSGAGIVNLAVPKGIYSILAAGIYEAVFTQLDQAEDGGISFSAIPQIKEKLENATSVLIGPGLGRGGDMPRVVEKVVESADCPVIIDADGINALQGGIDIIRSARAEIVMTPHPGEMARFLGRTVDEVESDRIATAREVASLTGAVVVLKGARTVVAAPNSLVYINVTGNAGMATGGSGDMLSGMIAAFLGRGFSAETAACAGVYFHGLAGDKAAEDLTETAMLPSDMIERLPFVFK